MSFVGRTKRAVGYGLTKDDEDQKVDNEDYLYDLLGSIPHGVLNGSFENLDGSDPSNMTISVTGTGTSAIDTDTADTVHGYRSLLMTTAAVDDTVQLDWDDYTPCEAGERIAVDFSCKLSAATLTLKVEILWYYYNGSAFTAATTSSTTLYDASTGNPTSWQTFKRQAVAPSGASPAKYYRLRFTFGKASAATTGTCHLDNIKSRVFHGLVPLTRASKSFGTIDISSNTGDETAIAALFYVTVDTNYPDPAETTTITATATGYTMMSFNVFGGGIQGRNITATQIYVPVDDSEQCSVAKTGGGSETAAIYLIGYYV